VPVLVVAVHLVNALKLLGTHVTLAAVGVATVVPAIVGIRMAGAVLAVLLGRHSRLGFRVAVVAMLSLGSVVRASTLLAAILLFPRGARVELGSGRVVSRLSWHGQAILSASSERGRTARSRYSYFRPQFWHFSPTKNAGPAIRASSGLAHDRSWHPGHSGGLLTAFPE
jgi:hypothetical protein